MHTNSCDQVGGLARNSPPTGLGDLPATPPTPGCPASPGPVQHQARPPRAAQLGMQWCTPRKPRTPALRCSGPRPHLWIVGGVVLGGDGGQVEGPRGLRLLVPSASTHDEPLLVLQSNLGKTQWFPTTECGLLVDWQTGCGRGGAGQLCTTPRATESGPHWSGRHTDRERGTHSTVLFALKNWARAPHALLSPGFVSRV